MAISEPSLPGPPYTPAFGIVPQVLAGRAPQLARHERALLNGPRDPFFTQAIVGERGVGKTVFLSVLAERIHDRHNWIVVPYQARSRADAVSEILAELPEAAGRTWQGRGLRGLQKQVSVEVDAALLKVSGTVAAEPAAEPSPAMALARALRVVGEAAGRRQRGVMLAIDEAQILGEAALGDLGMVAQTVAHAGHLPVAVTMAGTPELSVALLRSGSFLERMPRTELGMLSRDEARLALLEPANTRGVTWDEAALDLVQNATGGYPYFVQLAGYHAWEHAQASRGTQIAADDARAAVLAVQRDADRIFRDRWERLGPAQRAYLTTVARLRLESREAERVATRAVAARLGKRQTDLSRVRGSLITDHHLLRAAARGEVEFAIPRFGAWLEEQISSPGGPPGAPSARRTQ